MSKILIFLLFILTFLGIIGGIGYTIYCGAWPIAVGLVAIGYLAYPKFVEYYNNLIK